MTDNAGNTWKLVWKPVNTYTFELWMCQNALSTTTVTFGNVGASGTGMLWRVAEWSGTWTPITYGGLSGTYSYNGGSATPAGAVATSAVDNCVMVNAITCRSSTSPTLAAGGSGWTDDGVNNQTSGTMYTSEAAHTNVATAGTVSPTGMWTCPTYTQIAAFCYNLVQGSWPELDGPVVTNDAATATDRTLTAPTGVVNGNTVLVAGAGNASASSSSITLGYNGSAGSGNWAEFDFEQATSTTFSSWLFNGTNDTSNTNFWAAHTTASRAWLWITAKLAGADASTAWSKTFKHSGGGAALAYTISTLPASAVNRLLVMMIDAGAGATDATTLPDGWAQIASGVSGAGTANGAIYGALYVKLLPSGVTPADNSITLNGTVSGGTATVWAIPLPGGVSHTTTIGTATNTGTAGTFTRTKSLTLGTATNTGIAGTFSRAKTIGLATVTNIGTTGAFTHSKSLTLGTVSNLGTTGTFIRAKSAGFGTATEAGAAMAFTTRSKALTLATDNDVETAGTFVRTKTLGIGTASETDTAGSLVVGRAALTLGTASEVDTTGTFVLTGSLVIGTATESGIAGGLTRAKKLSFTGTSEADATGTLSRSKLASFSVATEADVAHALGQRAKTLILTGVVESGQAGSFGQSKTLTLGTVTETGAAQTLSRTKLLPTFGTVTETGTAGVLTRSVSITIGSATEAGAAGTIDTRTKLLVLVGATEADIAGKFPFVVPMVLYFDILPDHTYRQLELRYLRNDGRWVK